jgi:hypothetical protein
MTFVRRRFRQFVSAKEQNYCMMSSGIPTPDPDLTFREKGKTNRQTNSQILLDG